MSLWLVSCWPGYPVAKGDQADVYQLDTSRFVSGKGQHGCPRAKAGPTLANTWALGRWHLLVSGRTSLIRSKLRVSVLYVIKLRGRLSLQFNFQEGRKHTALCISLPKKKSYQKPHIWNPILRHFLFLTLRLESVMYWVIQSLVSAGYSGQRDLLGTQMRPGNSRKADF